MAKLTKRHRRKQKPHGSQGRNWGSERRECRSYWGCLDRAAMANLTAVPCQDCSAYEPRNRQEIVLGQEVASVTYSPCVGCDRETKGCRETCPRLPINQKD